MFSDNYTGLLTRTSSPLNQNIYGTVANEVIDFCGIYKKIVAGNKGGGLQDTYYISMASISHSMYYLIGLHNSHISFCRV